MKQIHGEVDSGDRLVKTDGRANVLTFKILFVWPTGHYAVF